jgi:hypothetical protein
MADLVAGTDANIVVIGTMEKGKNIDLVLGHIPLALDPRPSGDALQAGLSACRGELQVAEGRVQALSVELDRIEAENAELRKQNAVLRVALQVDHDMLKYQHQHAKRREAISADDAARLQRLVSELRFPDGPRALRAVLPLARILRRLRGGRPSATLPIEATTASLAQLVADDKLPTPTPRRSLAKWLILLGYAPVRPFVRPLAWRTRSFLTGEIHSELARLDDKLQLLGTSLAGELHGELARLDDKLQLLRASLAGELHGELARLNDQLKLLRTSLTGEIHGELRQLDAKLELLRTFLTGESSSELTRLGDRMQLLLGRPEKSQELTELQAEVRQFGKMLETTLLTLALEVDSHRQERSSADYDDLRSPVSRWEMNDEAMHWLRLEELRTGTAEQMEAFAKAVSASAGAIENLNHELATAREALKSGNALLKSLESERAETKAALAARDAEIAQMRRELTANHAAVASLHANLVAKEAMLGAIYSSTSWRVTALMRRFGSSPAVRWFVFGSRAWLSFKPGSRPHRVARRIQTLFAPAGHEAQRQELLVLAASHPEVETQHDLSPRCREIYLLLKAAIDQRGESN